MNVVLIIPTGVGAEIGGHAGDGNPVARLLGTVADKLILHPNVVNASDINEMPPNALYVEGSTLDLFLEREIALREVRSNRVLVAVNSPVRDETVNAVSAARATLGMQAEIVELETPLELRGWYAYDGRAIGNVSGVRELVTQLGWHRPNRFDALAIATPITVNPAAAERYLCEGGVNPWGGVEAMASKMIAAQLCIPVAHAPVGNTLEDFNEIVDPRMAAELVSVCYLHCVLKGLHRAPRIVRDPDVRWNRGLGVSEVDVLVTPAGLYGRPHIACARENIPIIGVRDNKTAIDKNPPDSYLLVDSYLEAAGLIAAMRTGVDPASLRRPLKPTKVV